MNEKHPAAIREVVSLMRLFPGPARGHSPFQTIAALA
jgi:hypothetical protein